MKKIAIYSNDLSVGGIQKSLYNILRNIDYEKYKIDLYLLKENNFYEDKIPKEVNIRYLNKKSKMQQLIPFSINMKLYKYEGLKKEYDVAIDFDSYQQLTALNVLKCNAKKKIMWIHSDWEQKRKYEIRYKIGFFFSKQKNKYFDKYIGVSKGAIESFIRINKFDNIDYEIIPNLIDTKEIFDKSNEKCDLKVDNKKYNFCSLGRVAYSKGFDILLNNIDELRKKRKDFHFYLIGDGPEMNNIKKIIEEKKLKKYVTLLGLQKNPFKYMKLMDGFVLTSRYEGQGMVLWEAKAIGLDIFMTKNLEKYNNDLYGFDDIVTEMAKCKKKKKKFDYLDEYNKNILNKIDELFETK